MALTILSEQDIVLIHEATLDVLENAGVTFLNVREAVKILIERVQSGWLAGLYPTPARREEPAVQGIPANYVRVSVGLESPDDIIADLDQALCIS